MTPRFLVALALAALVPLAGCASMVSTMFGRNESNTAWQREEHLRGVPVTLKVPTHVKVYVYEHYFLDSVSVGDTKRARRLKLPYVVRDFAQEFIYTEKIFTVDFKRPAAGTFNLRLDMTKDQYIQRVQHDVTDETIERVGNLIGAIATGFMPTTRSGESTAVDEALYEIKSVVAVGIFEIEAPDFEEQLATFVNCHLNQSHDAWVVPPGVKEIHRVGISPREEIPLEAIELPSQDAPEVLPPGNEVIQ